MATATQQFNVSNKLTLESILSDDETVNTTYKCKVPVTLAGDSIWDCTVKKVTITEICISETDWGDDEPSIHIAVIHTGKDESWRMYTDSGFEEAVSELLGCSVSFTEQGMQEDGYASMEL